MTKNRLYPVVLIAVLAGCIWLAICWGEAPLRPYGGEAPLRPNQGCIFHAVTGIPCPSCGTTRSVVSILHGDMAGSVHYNPLGWLMLAVLILFPLWVLGDYIFRKETFFRFYRNTETILRKKAFYIPAILLIMANWIWGIIKHL